MTGQPPTEDLLRELAPQVLGVLVRRYGDFDTAEDAVQEALLAAAAHWPRDGVPDNPRAWLIQAASRNLLDHLRGDQARRLRDAQAGTAPEPRDTDDSLAMLFLCCHPSLTPAAAIALTLRAIGGLTTAEIGRALLVPEATVAQRISRAKQRIKAAGTPSRMPDPDELPERLRSVLHTLYLIFNEGYAAGADPHRPELAEEAIRLTRTLHRALPRSEVTGLLALMLLIDARTPARTGPGGELVPLDEQDRSRWDRDMITEGTALINRAIAQGAVGEYQLQAAIAALHDRAEHPAETDWPQIAALYGLLEQMTGNPLVSLNRAVAVAMAHGPQAGLELLTGLDQRLPGHYRLAAVRAHLLELAGDGVGALAYYRAAAARTTSLPERQYLTAKAARLAADLHP